MKNFKEFAMRKGTKLLVGIAGLALAGLSVQAQTTSYQYHQPANESIQDVCMPGNPTIALSGEMFYEYFFQQQPNGDTHMHITVHYNVTGTENGINYVSTEQYIYDLKTDPDGFPPQPTSDFHTSDKFHLIAQGPYPKMTVQSFMHVKVNAQNVVTVNQDQPSVVKCQGK